MKRFYITSYRNYLIENEYELSTINKKMNSIQSFNKYLVVNEWIKKITDITEDVKKLRELKNNNTLDIGFLPNEKEYYVDDNVRDILGMR